jgi:predicted membrane protein DUF2207
MNGTPDFSDLLIMLFLAVPLFVVARMFWRVWTEGRDAERDSASVQYEPPDKLTPGECGALVDNVFGVHLITATIVDLSVKGYLAIEPTDGGSVPAQAGGKNYVFHMLKSMDDWKVLKDHEREVLKGIFLPANLLRMMAEMSTEATERFQAASRANPLMAERVARFEEIMRMQAASEGHPLEGHPLMEERSTRIEAMTEGDWAARLQPMTEGVPRLQAISEAKDEPEPTVEWLELQNRFFMRLAKIRTSLFTALVGGGYYPRRPDQTQLLYNLKGIFAGLAMAVAGTLLALKMRMVPWPWTLIGILTGVFIAASGKLLSSRTAAGARTYAKLLGFKEYLQRVEKGQIETLDKTPDLFEKYLPYAMALRVENKWSQAFGSVTVAAPGWYRHQDSGDFLPKHMMDDLAGMSNQAGSVLTSRPGTA